MRPIKVLAIADPQADSRARDQVELEPGIVIVTRTSSIDVALHHLSGRELDVVLVDADMQSADALALVERVHQTRPALPVVAVAADPRPQMAQELVRHGTRAILPRTATLQELAAAIRSVHAGHSLIPPHVLSSVLELLRRPGTAPAPELSPPLDTLTNRERELLQELVDGRSRKEIAARLHMSVHTVRTHVRNILVKLGVHSSLEAVSVALRSGMRPRGPPPLHLVPDGTAQEAARRRSCASR